MFSKLLVANRGEIACRVFATAKRMGIRTVAVFSEVDAEGLHVQLADEACCIGPAEASKSYLNIDAILDAAKRVGAEAIHPGYGFLSENADFVDAVEAAGLTFIGPSAESIRQMGFKDAARSIMERVGVPIVPGYHGDKQHADALASEAEEIGYPLLVKACAGGGGKGMRRVNSAAELASAVEGACREAQSGFGNGKLLIEKLIQQPRHIEVQVFGDTHGSLVHLFERDCSLQRNHQKVIEEAPAPGISDEFREAVTSAAIKAAKAVDYVGAGTVEFIADGSGPLRPDGFWFLEMNTRLQVEHTVTEEITGEDLVEWQIRVAAGEKLPKEQDEIAIAGHAFESRIYAEDVSSGFLPVTGRIPHLTFGRARVDTGVQSGNVVSPWYDPLIAKVITSGHSRCQALSAMRNALADTHIAGVETNIGLLSALCEHDDFAAGRVDTGLIDRDFSALTELDPKHFDEAVALGAFVALDIVDRGPFAGWRQWGSSEHRLQLTYKQESVLRRLVLSGPSSAKLLGGDAPVLISDLCRDGSRIRADVNGVVTCADVYAWLQENGDTRVSVLSHGTTTGFTIPNPLNQGEEPDGAKDEILSPITGIVRSVDVELGANVGAGDPLLTVEAMKMEIRITADAERTIGEILCAEGDSVESGAVLVRFAELAADESGGS